MLPKPSVTFPMTLESLGTLSRLGTSLLYLHPLQSAKTTAKSEISAVRKNDRRITFILNTDDPGGSLPLGNKKRHSFKK